MSAERWARVQQLFQLALDCEPRDRAVFLDRECEGDEELRRDIQTLLASERGAHDYLKAVVQDAIQAGAVSVTSKDKLPTSASSENLPSLSPGT